MKPIEIACGNISELPEIKLAVAAYQCSANPLAYCAGFMQPEAKAALCVDEEARIVKSMREEENE